MAAGLGLVLDRFSFFLCVCAVSRVVLVPINVRYVRFIVSRFLACLLLLVVVIVVGHCMTIGVCRMLWVVYCVVCCSLCEACCWLFAVCRIEFLFCAL